MSSIPNLPVELLHGAQTSENGPGPQTGAIHGGKSSINGSTQDFQLPQHPIENFRPLKVIVIGAGFSGIYLGIRIPERIRNCELVIYDKNDGLGGTWWEARYPGCACDIPAHSYQYSFEPNPNWSRLYAPASEIQAYLEGTAKKYGADRFVKLRHLITDCRWNSECSKWYVSVKNLQTGENFEDISDVLVSARGMLNVPAWPSIDGLKTFKGELMHSAIWNEKYDFSNKRIGIIGTGSSAIQIVPSLQRLAGTKLSCFIRGKTWISPPFGSLTWGKLGVGDLEDNDFAIPEELKERLRNDPEYHMKFRCAIEEDGNIIHSATIRGTPMQIGGQEMFRAHMKDRLKTRPDILESIMPSFAPGCRRLTPGPGFLEALTQPNVDFINTQVQSINETGVLLDSGRQVDVDALVCATGFHTTTPPPFSVCGSNGITIASRFEDRPLSYLSLGLDGFPNFFMILGPNSAIGAGSLTIMIENIGNYIVRCIRKLQREDVACMAPRPEAVREFTEFADTYFKDTVYTDECRSWYRKGDKITGLWPGSSMHCVEVMRAPRWEDWEYVRLRPGAAWLGNGWSEKQMGEVRDMKDLAWYLRDEFVDKPPQGKPEEGGKYAVQTFV